MLFALMTILSPREEPKARSTQYEVDAQDGIFVMQRWVFGEFDIFVGVWGGHILDHVAPYVESDRISIIYLFSCFNVSV